MSVENQEGGVETTLRPGMSGGFIVFWRQLHGWRRLLAAALFGGIAVLGLAPFFLIPVLLVSFTGLIWLLDGLGSDRRGLVQAFWTGWAFGVGFFAAGLYWIGHAFFVDAATFAWLVPFVALLFPSGLAIFIGLTAVLYRYLAPAGPGRVLVLAASWTLLEFVRGHIFSGFPWNLMGYAWADTLAIAQVTSLVGVYGLSLLTVALVGAPAALVSPFKAAAGGRTGRAPGGIVYCAGVVVLFLAVFVFGQMRLGQPILAEQEEPLTFRLVQADIDQRDKFDPAKRIGIMERYLALSLAPREPGTPPADVVIWPEAAPPFLLTEDEAALQAISDILAPGQILLTGTPRRGFDPSTQKVRYFNSLKAIDETGSSLRTYDKSHLVPFGEYLPFEPLLSALGITKLTGGDWGFTSGEGLTTFDLPAVPAFSPLICYEAIFPGRAVGSGERPAWLLNITDDSWFGTGAGPQQHFMQARLRAIEEGLPLVRLANKGISAVVDSRGRIVSKLDMGRAGVLDGELPPATAGTVFSRVGHGALGLLLVLAFVIGARVWPERTRS